MPNVSYGFDVNQQVWCVDKEFGVRYAVVKSVDVLSNAINYPPVVTYTVMFQYPTGGSNQLHEDAVFGDVDSALTAYRAIITRYIPT